MHVSGCIDHGIRGGKIITPTDFCGRSVILLINKKKSYHAKLLLSNEFLESTHFSEVVLSQVADGISAVFVARELLFVQQEDLLASLGQVESAGGARRTSTDDGNIVVVVGLQLLIQNPIVNLR